MIGIMNIFILLPRLALFINIFLIYTIVYNALFKFLKIDQKKNILPFENQYNIYLQFFNSKIAQTIVILTNVALLIEFLSIF